MAGLVATVITKWKANDKYSYGYVRAETLAGFINGLFLLFISFFIFSEVNRFYKQSRSVKWLSLVFLLLSVSLRAVATVKILGFTQKEMYSVDRWDHGDVHHRKWLKESDKNVALLISNCSGRGEAGWAARSEAWAAAGGLRSGLPRQPGECIAAYPAVVRL